MVMKICIKCGKIIPGEHGLALRGSLQPLALGLDAGMAQDEGAHPRQGRLRCTVHVRPGERCEGTKLLEIHHIDGGGDVLLVPDEELRTVCRKHNPRGG